MAIIPQIAPRVRQQAAPNPVYQSSAGATPDAFGASIGRGLEVLGQGISAVSDVMQDIQVQQQETELKSLDVEFSNRVRTLMYGDPENETPGYLSTQNDDAVDGHVPLRDAIMKAREELVSSAGSDTVRSRFTVAADRRVNQALTQAAQHSTRARQSQALVISQARISNAQNDAANNPDTVKEGLAVVQSEVETYLLKTGQSDEDVILNKVLEQQSALVEVSIAGALGRKDPEQAAMILRQNADFMTGEDRAKASLSVLQALTLNEAQTIFDEILGLDLEGEEAIEFARANATGQVRSKLIALIDAEEGRSTARTRFAQGQDDRARTGEERANIKAGIDLAQEAQDRGLTGKDAEDYVKERADGIAQEKALQVVRSGSSADRARAQEARVLERDERTEQEQVADDEGIALAQIVQDSGMTGEEAEAYIVENSFGKARERALSILRTGESVGNARDRAAYERFVKNRTEFVDDQLQDIIDQVEDPVARDVLLEQKRNLDPEQFTPTVIRLIKGKLSTQATLDRNLEAERLATATQSASAAVAEGQTLDDFISENPGFAAEIAKSAQTLSLLRAADKARSSGELFSRNSDGATLHAIRTLPTEQLATLDLDLHRHKLTSDEYDDASRRISAALASVNKGGQTGEGAAYAGARRILTNLLPKKRDYGSREASESDRDFNRAATNAANLSIHNFISRTGKVPTEPELNDLVYEAIAELYVDDSGFGIGVFVGEDEVDFLERKDLSIDQKETARIDYQDISDHRLSQMIEDARRGSKYPGGAVPKDVLEQVYGAFVLKDMARYKRLLGVQ